MRGTSRLISVGSALTGGTLVLIGLGILGGGVWYPRMVAIGIGFSVISVATGMVAIRQLTAPTYGPIEESEPELSPEAYADALLEAELPAWTCIRCRVVEPPNDLAFCPYCVAADQRFDLDNPEDVLLVHAGIT